MILSGCCTKEKYLREIFCSVVYQLSELPEVSIVKTFSEQPVIDTRFKSY